MEEKPFEKFAFVHWNCFDETEKRKRNCEDFNNVGHEYCGMNITNFADRLEKGCISLNTDVQLNDKESWCRISNCFWHQKKLNLREIATTYNEDIDVFELIFDESCKYFCNWKQIVTHLN